MKKKIAIAFFMMIQASEAFAGRDLSRCGEIIPSVAIEYQRIERISAWGREIDFARFKLENKSRKNLKFAISGGDSPAVFHGAFETLQSRKYGSSDAWEEFDPALDEYLPPVVWLVVGPTGEMVFFADLVGPMSVPDRSKSLEFRLSVKDMVGCEYASSSFRLAP